MIEPVVAEIEEFLAQGWSEAEIAERLGLKRDTLPRWMSPREDRRALDGYRAAGEISLARWFLRS